MPKIKLKVDEEIVKTYSSKVSLSSCISFHRLGDHPHEVYETVNGRFTAVFNPTVKKHYIREKGFLLKADVFK